jgi:P-type Cu2+ transporter
MMTCCPVGPAIDAVTLFAGDLEPWVTTRPDGSCELDLIIPGICSPESITVIEGALERLPGLASARVNFTGKRVVAIWNDPSFKPVDITEKLNELGFISRPFDPSHSGLKADDAQSRLLLRAIAVSGFAAANIMLLSVSVWSGAEGSTRDLFHWISAGIALPTVAYAGRPFFRSAIRALSSGQFNMDIPISLAVCLAALMSLYETFNHGEVAYFDASVTLLFFLLTGRYLDHLMRARARSAVSQLLSLSASSAMIEDVAGASRIIAATALQPKMKMLVAAGERLAADGVVISGTSEIDRSLLTGESNPELAVKGAIVHAGMLNLTGPLTVDVTAAGQDTFLAEIIRLMASAEQSRSRYVQIADKLARIYSPAVHILAASTLVGWLIWTGGDWHSSLMTAIAVLIITCPCALGLAVPAVQTVASGVLFRNGVMIKDGAALEKLSEIDTVIFDKTGTLTLGRPRLTNSPSLAISNLALAAGLARQSRHPLSRAVCEAAKSRGIAPAALDNIEELPGNGLSGRFDGKLIRLGSRRWCGLQENGSQGLPEFVLARGGATPVIFTFEDELRPDAASVIAKLREEGLRIEILSGDRETPVSRAASALGIEFWQAGVTPQQKLAYVQSLKEAGRKVLMIGDGLNDAPALAAGHTSLAPSSATDIGRTAADTIFMGESLMPLLVLRDVAIATQRLSIQNFTLAVGYNFLAVPIAMLGFASPLIAAVAMSTSSIIVIANSLRLGLSFSKQKAMVVTKRQPDSTGISHFERRAA